jgi:predicted phage tail protein
VTDEIIKKVNGGYRIIARGSGGGKKQSSSSSSSAAVGATEQPNNLRSRDDASILVLLGEGEIAGSASGDLLRDIYLDETPIKNADGSLNFQNVTVDFRSGTQFQSYIPAFASDIESEESIGVQIKKSTGAITRTITNVNANALRLRFLIPALQRQDDKGNITGTEVDFLIEISTQGGAFIEVARPRISGKTSGNYSRSYRLPLTTTGSWSVRVTRLTNDAVDNKIQNDLYWQSITEIVDAKLRYPNSALLGVRVSSEQFQSFPKVSIKLKQLIISIPHNYDPIARTYSGIFNGSLYRAYSNNPAWVLYDLITNNRYGCGRFINTSQIDVFSLYSIAQYCDGAVSNGRGGVEPRFVCNAYIDKQDDAYKLLEAIASCFRGMMYHSGNTITTIQDKPALPVRAYTKANVVVEYDEDGRQTTAPFNYSGSSLESRYSVALVTYSDPDDFYREKVELYENRELLTKFGYNPTRITAFGCTSRSQAYRIGKWTLLSQYYLTQTVTFKVGAEGLLVRPGEVFKVMDSLKSNSRLGGRILTATTTSITLDSEVAIAHGITYTISGVKADGNLETQSVLNGAGNYTVLTTNAFSEVPRHVWILESNQLKAQLFRCVAVVELEPHLYEITGVEYNDSIYDAVENDIKFEELPINGLPNIKAAPQPPSGLTATELLYETIGSGGVKAKIELRWNASPSPFLRQYQVEYRSSTETDSKIIETTQNLSSTVFDLQPETYFCRVKAINNYGLSSNYAETVVVVNGLVEPPSDVTNFTVIPYEKYAVLKWDTSPDLDVRVGGFFKIKQTYKKNIFSWADGIEISQVPGSSNSVQVPLLNGSYLIKAIDSSGNQSRNAAVVILDNFADINAFNAIASLVESPTFSGTKTDTTVVGGVLRLTSTDYFDSATGNFDSATGNFDEFAGYFDSVPGNFDSAPGDFEDLGTFIGISQSGSYEFSAPIDLGDVYTSRVTATMSALNVNETILFDRTGGNFDDLTGSFDGEDNDSGSAILQIATSQNGSTYSDFSNFLIGDYLARSFKFRLLLTNSSANHNIYVDRLEVNVDAPDRMESGAFTTFTFTDSNVFFNNAFATTPEVALTIQGAAVGDYVDFVSKSASSFVFNVRNSSGTRIARNVSFLAKGYGKKQ